jgi:hypothetical protein
VEQRSRSFLDRLGGRQRLAFGGGFALLRGMVIDDQEEEEVYTRTRTMIREMVLYEDDEGAGDGYGWVDKSGWRTFLFLPLTVFLFSLNVPIIKVFILG